MYDCDGLIGYVSDRDRRTYGGINVCLRSSAMGLDQNRAHCGRYADKSPVYVKDTWIFRASSRRPARAQILHVDNDAHGTYESYAVSEEPRLPISVKDDTLPSDVPRVIGTDGLALQPLLD